MDKHKKNIAWMLLLVLVFSTASALTSLAVPNKAQAITSFGGLNVVYVPRIYECPQHIWVRDFRTGLAFAMIPGDSYDNHHDIVPGAFALGMRAEISNSPCIIVPATPFNPPIYLPYPLYNIQYEGTS